MAYKIFIDGKEGTTGLKIYERFSGRKDIELILIDEDKRKDPAARAECINASDFTFLCLPDAASREAVSLCSNPNTRIIDPKSFLPSASPFPAAMPAALSAWFTRLSSMES